MISLRQLLFLLLAIFVLGCLSYKVEPLLLPTTPSFRNHGEQLVNGMAACGFCHGEKPAPSFALTGGRKFYDRYGEAVASNLTPDKTGLADWDTRSYLNYFRSYLDPEGEETVAEFHKGMEWMADQDLYSIVGYLATLPAQKNATKKRTVGWWKKNIDGFFDSKIEVWGVVPEIEKSDSVAYGRYLVENVARCTYCHNGLAGWFSDEPYLGGKELKFEDGYIDAPALVGKKQEASNWSQAEIITYLKTGKTAVGKNVDSTACPVEFYANAKDSHLEAVASFISSLSKP